MQWWAPPSTCKPKQARASSCSRYGCRSGCTRMWALKPIHSSTAANGWSCLRCSPVHFYGKAYVRDGTSKTELSKYPEKERTIWHRRVDWSAQVCEQATLDDLDPRAIAKARAEFTTKVPCPGGSGGGLG